MGHASFQPEAHVAILSHELKRVISLKKPGSQTVWELYNLPQGTSTHSFPSIRCTMILYPVGLLLAASLKLLPLSFENTYLSLHFLPSPGSLTHLHAALMPFSGRVNPLPAHGTEVRAVPLASGTLTPLFSSPSPCMSISSIASSSSSSLGLCPLLHPPTSRRVLPLNCTPYLPIGICPLPTIPAGNGLVDISPSP